MDPNAVLAKLLNAFGEPDAEGARQDACDALYDMLTWIKRGGFMPRYVHVCGASDVLRDALRQWEPQIAADESISGADMVDWFVQTFVLAAREAIGAEAATPE